MFLNGVSKVLGSNILLLVSVIFLSISVFYFVANLIRQSRVKRRGILILLAIANGVACWGLEIYSKGVSNLFIISLITAFLITQISMVYKGNARVYWGIYWIIALLLQYAYLFSCAIVNLGLSGYYEKGGLQHRFSVFSLTMVLCTMFFLFCGNFKESNISILYDIIREKSKSSLLIIYSLISTTVLAVSGHLITDLLYSEVPAKIEQSMFSDVLLKNTLILGSGFLIFLFQIRQEQSNRRNIQLEQGLETEKDFRKNLISDSLLSYTANITKDCFVDGFESVDGDNSGYQDRIIEFILNSVHPHDMDIVKELMEKDYYERHLAENPNYTLRIRIATKALLLVPQFRISQEVREQISREREWIWSEFHITVVRDKETGDILAYVSVQSVDKEMAERESLLLAANTDPLTGLLNRNGMEEMMTECFNSGNVTGTLFMIDMDYFKSVNDKLGHPTGDKALQDMAETLNTVFRTGDIVGRIGGDEFSVFALGLTDSALIESRAQNLGEKGRRKYTSPDGKTEVHVSLSIGIAVLSEKDCNDYQELYHLADEALYEAKEAGRNTYRIYRGCGK